MQINIEPKFAAYITGMKIPVMDCHPSDAKAVEPIGYAKSPEEAAKKLADHFQGTGIKPTAIACETFYEGDRSFDAYYASESVDE